MTAFHHTYQDHINESYTTVSYMLQNASTVFFTQVVSFCKTCFQDMGTVRCEDLRLHFKYTYLGLLQLRDDSAGLGLDQAHRFDLGRVWQLYKIKNWLRKYMYMKQIFETYNTCMIKKPLSKNKPRHFGLDLFLQIQAIW